MKAIYTFMIGLILFNFYACSKQTYNPKENNFSVNSNLEITYLDENNQATENKTETILMKLKDDESGFIMVSKKMSENEYTDYLIDTENNSTISMFYTNIDNQEAFPYKIVIVQGEESMVGYTSKYREETKDFDIIWEMSNGSTTDYETFANIPITAVFNHATTPGVEPDTDYQIKTLKVSVRIADAINKYIDDNFSENSMMRGKIWNAFCSFWKNIFKPIAKVVTVIVAVIFPPVAPIIATVVKIADIIIDAIDNAITGVEDKGKASSGVKNLYILKYDDNYHDENNQYSNNEEIYLKSSGATTNIIFIVTDASIGEFKGYASVSNENINASNYYEFSDKNGNNYPVNSENQFLYSKDFNNGGSFNLVIKRKVNKMGYIVFIDIKLADNIFVNDRADVRDFRLILQQDEN